MTDIGCTVFIKEGIATEEQKNKIVKERKEKKPMTEWSNEEQNTGNQRKRGN